MPSHLYSFSFAPGHHWSRRYAPQPEILTYLEQCAARLRHHTAPAARHRGDRGAASTPSAGAGPWSPTRASATSSICSSPPAASSPGRRSRRCPGSTTSRGPVVPLRRVGPRPRPRPARRRRRRRHRGERDPVRPRDRARSPRRPRSTSARRRGSCRRRTAPTLSGSDACFAASPLRVAASRLGLFAFFETGTYGFTGHRSVLAPFRKLADWERQPAARRRPGAAGEGDPRLRDRLQAGPVHERLVPDPAPRRRRAGHRGDRAGRRRLRSSPPTASSAKPTRSSTAPASRRHNFVAPMDVHGLDGRELNAFWAERPEAYLGTTVSGLPEHVRPLRAEHQPRLGLGPVHARVAVQLHRRRGRRACATATGAGSICGPRPRRRGGTRSPSAASTPSGRPVAARAGT